jgi:predicted DCC family thiol-disulfide oxidoreductase YuxK
MYASFMAGEASTAPASASRIVLFDGVCGLCSRTVRFVLRRDRESRFVYSPLQGETAAAILERHGLAPDLETMIYVDTHAGSVERIYTKSDAILHILDDLGGVWRLVAGLRILPRPLRDGVYDLIARHRYRWFGRFESCRLPAPEQQSLFLP